MGKLRVVGTVKKMSITILNDDGRGDRACYDDKAGKFYLTGALSRRNSDGIHGCAGRMLDYLLWKSTDFVISQADKTIMREFMSASLRRLGKRGDCKCESCHHGWLTNWYI